MKVQVPIIHLVRIFMISRTSTYHNVDYVELGNRGSAPIFFMFSS